MYCANSHSLVLSSRSDVMEEYAGRPKRLGEGGLCRLIGRTLLKGKLQRVTEISREPQRLMRSVPLGGVAIGEVAMGGSARYDFCGALRGALTYPGALDYGTEESAACVKRLRATYHQLP